jgi:D-serine dehydratase
MATDRSPGEVALSAPVDWRHKAFALAPGPVEVDGLHGRGWRVFDGDLLFPLVVVKESAVHHNVALMARFASEHGVSLAPHAKTTMAPDLFLRELEAGAWGLTAQTVSQARIYREFGVKRILLANELLQELALRWVTAEMASDPDFDFYCLVDSVEGIGLMTEALGAAGPRLQVLIELGRSGGRAGCRNFDEVVSCAEAVMESPALELAGAEAFDGFLTGAPGDPEAIMRAVEDYLHEFADAVIQLADLGYLAHRDEVLVSAGSSAFFDRAASILTARLADVERPTRLVMRCGAYVTHDALYHEISPLDGRATRGDRLQPALEAWGMVLSRPEPTLAIVGFGKRDVPYDAGLPEPQLIRRRSGELTNVTGLELLRVDDHHAYLDVSADELAVGDLVGFSVSHSCTAFDKWSAVPLVDDDYTVVGVIRTFF